ncbi:MAG: carboxypeptidase regulatory-like domain-containing protein [Nitrospiraceae bacterium]|nr:MAG: carboxypeptidase regulatory-like domain-containing protein [Nitrospiraceae bacterium]
MTTCFERFIVQRSIALFFFLAALFCVASDYSMAADEGTSVIRGKISDAEGLAVEGAMVYLYGSADVKRSADFISARTDKEGKYSMVVPAGKYWLVARSKNTDDYGPLMLKDRHSGDPREADLASGSKVEIDFVVADLMEAIKMKREERERAVKITGRIVDEKGSPVNGAYAIANRNKEISGVPDYLSAWVDHEGRYVIYVPRGRYFIGSALSFPPGHNYSLGLEADIDADTLDMDITRKSTKSRSE